MINKITRSLSKLSVKILNNDNFFTNPTGFTKGTQSFKLTSAYYIAYGASIIYSPISPLPSLKNKLV